MSGDGSVATSGQQIGLSSDEASRRLRAYGPNEVPEPRGHPLRALLRRLWAPVPWMLEATIAVELVAGKLGEAAVVAVLLAFNAGLSFVQESRAQGAVRLLRQRLTVTARVRRDGEWRSLAARELVPGDVVHVRLGDVVPADVTLAGGELLADQSALTGESLPVELASGGMAYAGAVVSHGEATGEVTATGSRTFFGRTAELVRTARTASHLEEVILRIVRGLVLVDLILLIAVVTGTLASGRSASQVLGYAVVLLLASVPVALPATFALATSLGSLELARRGVITARLSAIEEAAGMDILCTDKTGTITQNQLSVAALEPHDGSSQADLLCLAAEASDEATQDPIDLAILRELDARGVSRSRRERIAFEPFSPATKRSEALVRDGDRTVRVTKGAAHAIEGLLEDDATGLSDDVERLAHDGGRVLAIATSNDGSYRLAGLVALHDPPRPDSAELVRRLDDLGVRVIMITGDSLPTARAVAAQVGIDGPAWSAEQLRAHIGPPAPPCGVVAGVLPEDKLRLVQGLQRAGAVVGMTGDGVNDAPALKQAEVGIAVANATDVAKAAASLVLTDPGLGNVVAAIQTSRRIYQRMLTYAINMSIKKLEVPVFLSIALLATGVFPLTPLLMVLLLFANDFATMTITTDRVRAAPHPERWHVRELLAAAAGISLPLVGLLLGVLWYGRTNLELPTPQLRTLIFATLVLTSQATIYLVRERGHLWKSKPGPLVIAATVADILIVAVLATQGWLMTAISPRDLAIVAAASVCYLLGVDFLKTRWFAILGLRPQEPSTPPAQSLRSS